MHIVFNLENTLMLSRARVIVLTRYRGEGGVRRGLAIIARDEGDGGERTCRVSTQ